MAKVLALIRGQILYTPNPPTPENTLLTVGGGAYKRGGCIKFLPHGASKYTPPPPSPGKCLLARKGGEGGGGVYTFSLDSRLKMPSVSGLLAFWQGVFWLKTIASRDGCHLQSRPISEEESLPCKRHADIRSTSSTFFKFKYLVLAPRSFPQVGPTIFAGCQSLGNVSETPTPTTCLKSTAVHLQFVRHYAPHLYRRTFLASSSKKGKPCNTPPICTAVRPPFVRQYFWKILGVGVTGTFLNPCRRIHAGDIYRNQWLITDMAFPTIELLKRISGAFKLYPFLILTVWLLVLTPTPTPSPQADTIYYIDFRCIVRMKIY